jgi:outer membrane protein assembly factor BamB
MVWRRPLPPGKSSPVLSNGLVVLTAESGDSLQVIAIERQTGKVVWERSVKRQRNEYKNPLNDAASSSVVVDDAANVYAFFGDFGMVSVDRKGRERWRSPVKAHSSLWGAATSPMLAEGTVVLLLDGFASSSIIGFDAKTGRRKWETERAPFRLNYATPLLRQTTGGRCEVLAVSPNQIAAYDPATGQPRWDEAVPPGTMIGSPVFVDNDTVVAMIVPAEAIPPFPVDHDGDGVIGQADIPTDPKEWQTTRTLRMIAESAGDRDGKITTAEWSAFWRNLQGTPSISAFRISEPRGPRWSYTKGIARVATPLVYEGIVYYINNGGILTALDGRNGAPLKVGRLEGALDNYFSSIVAAAGRLYLASEAGKVAVVKAGTDWSVLAVNDLDEPCYASPALSDGKIFLRTARTLFCFGTA